MAFLKKGGNMKKPDKLGVFLNMISMECDIPEEVYQTYGISDSEKKDCIKYIEKKLKVRLYKGGSK